MSHRAFQFPYICRIVSLFLLAFLLTSCGYTFQGGGSILPADVRRIYIPLVENNSTNAELSTVMTEALRDSFERYGVITVVEDLNQADAVLKARILDVKRSTSTSAAKTDTALQQDLVLSLADELRRITGPVLWRDPKIIVTKTYGANQSVVVASSADFAGGALGADDLSNLQTSELTRGQEQEALSSMAEELAKKVYDQAVAPEF